MNYAAFRTSYLSAIFCASCIVTIPSRSRGDSRSTFLDQQHAAEANRHVSAAMAARKSGDALQEIKEWTEVIRLAPQTNAAFYYRAGPYAELTQFSKAIADTKEYIRREPNDPRGWVQLGDILADDGQIEKAIAACRRALQLKPNNAMAHAILGDTYRLNRQWPEALREAEVTLKLNPKVPRAYQVMGRVYAEQKDYQKATSAFSNALRLSPNWVDPLVARGDAFLDGGRFQSALADYQEAVKRFPRSSRAHIALAQFLATCPAAEWRKGNEALAEANIGCGQADWKDPYALAALSYALAETGDFAGAIRRMKQALAVALPDDRKEFQKQLDAFRKGKPTRNTDRSNLPWGHPPNAAHR